MAAASDEASETDCPILPTDDGPPDIGGCFKTSPQVFPVPTIAACSVVFRSGCNQLVSKSMLRRWRVQMDKAWAPLDLDYVSFGVRFGV